MKLLIINILMVAASFLNAELIPIEEKERLLLIAEQQITNRKEIWPSLDWQSSPLIVTFESGHIYAFNFKSQQIKGERISLGGHEVLFLKEDLWGLNDVRMQTVFEIEGQDAFVYKMQLTSSAKEDVTILAHERFHRHQAEQFMMNERPGNSLDHLSEENLTWGEIEDSLLRQFLQVESGEKLEILKDFIAVNQMRRKAIDPETKAWENHQLRMEGLADYFSTKIYGQEKQLLAIHPEVEHDNDFIDEAIKWRHYMAGAALGYALDFLLVPDWKERVEKGESLADMLASAMPIAKPEQNIRIIKVQKKLNYKKRRKTAEDKLNTHHKRVQNLASDYEKEAGIKLFLDRPRILVSGGGSNDEMVYLNNGSLLALNDASIATSKDGNWRFETKNVSHLFQHQRLREVKLNQLSMIKVNNYSIDLGEGCPKEYPFTDLQIACEKISLDSNKHPGVLIVDEAGLHVQYW